MVDMQSKEVIDKVSDELKVQPAMAIPKALAEKIQLVYGVNPTRIINVMERAEVSATGTTAIFTTPTDRDFFLTAYYFNCSATAAADNTVYTLAFSPEGKASESVRFPKLTLTAGNERIVMNYNPPIKLERGTTITMGTTFTVGAVVRQATIFGYTTDPQ